jgi:hypothetical protein
MPNSNTEFYVWNCLCFGQQKYSFFSFKSLTKNGNESFTIGIRVFLLYHIGGEVVFKFAMSTIYFFIVIIRVSQVVFFHTKID